MGRLRESLFARSVATIKRSFAIEAGTPAPAIIQESRGAKLSGTARNVI